MKIIKEMVPALPAPAAGHWDPAFRTGRWLVQEKHDGQNRPVKVAGGKVVATNRSGQAVALAPVLVASLVELERLTGPLLLNAEDLGTAGLVVFDIVSGLGITKAAGFDRRNEALDLLGSMLDPDGPIRVDVAVPLEAFVADGGHARLMSRGAEGYVLKRADAPYRPGRVAEAMRKVKFVQDATFRIAPSRAPGTRSVGIETLDGSKWVSAGNVKVPAGQPVPQPGTYADVQFVSISRHGQAVQPVFKGVRTDVGPDDCRREKLAA
ncbi:hypothetical protein [Paracoccus sanguinis]|uniref:ATP-dependent DNA ligase family profile domain-containing protein n=1 Tax=Paracoccus sanguinis TaxID=1545044 RepID=A0A099GNT3_9RHOB|nr:hypothetical protein [Paracoccus sanguinis]KGJ23738.1 hypothetical protein IX56_00200 [Paracoccus sanguinis]